MMKILVIFLFLGSVGTTTAKEVRATVAPYQIVSDEKTDDLLSGQVRVVGTVYTSRDQRGVNKALVSTIDNRVKTYSDSLGYYELIIHQTDTSIFVYFPGYEEVALPFYNFKAGHTVRINFNISFFRPIDEVMPVAYKPVIYLYADQPIKTTVQLNVHGNLTFSYPNYEKGWEMEVDEQGVLKSADSREYPYLFWEGELNRLSSYGTNFPLKGWVLNKDSIVPFLEDQLSRIGLNSKEKTDFITFWVPRMLIYNYVHIQFLFTEEYAQLIAEIKVNPKPDSLLRVYMLFKGYNERPTFEVKPQNFNSFERFGFSVVEWGGSELN